MGITRSTTYAALVAGALFLTANASAQSGSRGTMVMEDGGTRRVLHFSEPDFDAALKPDIVRADLRHFDQRLALSDVQLDAVERLIDAYLESIEELQSAMNEDESPRRRVRRGPEPEEGNAPDTNPIRDLIQEELANAGFDTNSDLPFDPRVEVGIDMQDNGDGPEPSVNVSVGFESKDDRMTEAMRAKLQEVAEKITPRVKEYAEKQMMERMGQRAMGGAPQNPGDEIDAKWNQITAKRAELAALIEKKNRLRSKLMTDVQVVLAEPQLAKWPSFDRALTRIKTLPQGKLDGEKTDLIEIVEDVEPTDAQREAIAALLTAYEEQLHQALVRRNKMLEQIDGEIDTALYEGDTRKARNLADRVSRSRVAIRSLNEQFIEAIAAELGDTDGRFRNRAMVDAYPSVFRPTIAALTFDQVAAIDGLDAGTREAVQSLQTAYASQLTSINRQLVGTIRKQQAAEFAASIDRAIAMTDGVEDELPDHSASLIDRFRQRQRLNAQYMRNLYGMLTPEQIATLPSIPVIDAGTPVVAEDFDADHDS